MRWWLVGILALSLMHCGKDKKRKRSRSRAQSTENAMANGDNSVPHNGPTVSAEGKPQKLKLSWDAQKSKGKVELIVVAKGKKGYEQRVNLGTHPYNTPYEDGMPDGCGKCKDRYTTCKKMKAKYGPEEADPKDFTRISGALCARLDRFCVETCESSHFLSVDFDDGVLTASDYGSCYGYRKPICIDAPKIVKQVRIAPKGSTLSKKRLSKGQAEKKCHRKHCGRCSNSGFTRCMKQYGYSGWFDCFCG